MSTHGRGGPARVVLGSTTTGTVQTSWGARPRGTSKDLQAPDPAASQPKVLAGFPVKYMHDERSEWKVWLISASQCGAATELPAPVMDLDPLRPAAYTYPRSSLVVTTSPPRR